MDMRGLSTFIAEIRKASQTRDGEFAVVNKELAKIRSKFKEAKELSGYDRKKYICKLLYMFMLGYDIDFGHMEAIRLLSGTKYSEKHIGYLACSILLHEQHELLTLITNQVKIDLNSGKELHQCLALTAIANIGGKEFAEAMAHDVQKIVVASDTRPHVRKKSTLTLLRLYRKYADMVQPEVVAAPLLDLLANPDFGVVNCALSLLLGFLAKCDTSTFEGATTKAIRILTRIVLNKETPPDYVYFGVPAPWVQMKALRVLQHFPPPADATLQTQVTNSLSKIINAADKLSKEQSMQAKPARGAANRSNAMNGVLVEALSLTMHYDNDPELLGLTAGAFGRFLNEKKDANMRYLGLSLMSRMSYCQSVDFLASVREHQLVIINSLRDHDISIRRRALDMLYCMCDTSNAGEIVGELLEYLPTADFNIREDLVLKIAILAEKYAADLTWYIDVILNIIVQAGDYVSEDVWQRLCQIVTNNPTLQKHAAEMVFKAVAPTSAAETLVKVASFVLGEYGDQIARGADSPPMAQFNALHNKFLLVSPATRALMLTAYLKYFNMYPNANLRDKITKVFLENRSHLDVELQQRAQEYYVLCVNHEDVLSSAIDAMPPFEMKNNSVLQAMQNRTKDVTDKDVWRQKSQAKEAAAKLFEQVDAREHQQHPEPEPERQTSMLDIEKLKEETKPTTTENKGSIDDLFSVAEPTSTTPPAPQQPKSQPPADPMDSMFVGTTTTTPAPASTAQAPPKPSGGLLDDIFSSTPSGAPSQLGAYNNTAAVAEMEKHRRNASIAKQGVLYEDERIQIGCSHEYHGSNGRVTLFYGNKSMVAIENFKPSLGRCPQGVQVQLQSIADKIEPRQQMQQQVALLCGTAFQDSPVIKLAFVCGGLSTDLELQLPALAARFTEPIPGVTNRQQFFQHWHGVPVNIDSVILSNCTRPMDVPTIETFLQQVLKAAPLRVDENPNNITASGMFTTTSSMGAQRTPVLMNIETNPNMKAVRLTVKTANPIVQQAYVNLMKMFFGC